MRTKICSLFRLHVCVWLVLLSGAGPGAFAADAKAPGKPKTPPDVIVFNNGDQLTGKLIQVLDGKVTFHSDIVGDVTVPWDKVKTLKASESFAVIEKKEKLTRTTAERQIAVGPVSVANQEIQVERASGQAPQSYSTRDTGYLVDQTAFEKEVRGETEWFYGWSGTVTLGAALVEGTDTNQTYSGAVNFVRNIPTVTWLPLGSKTSLNLSGTYGLATQPEIVSDGNLIQTASVSKTDILHGDTEYDRYFSPRVFWLAGASADHNFGSGLELQQTYGAGIGWSVIKNAKQTLDLKTDLHYQQQQFYNGVTSGLGTPTVNLIGMDLVETWTRTLKSKIKFVQSVSLSPTFNVPQAYSGAASANLTLPLYKQFNFTFATTDNYLGDPPEGYQRNSYQLTAGITYTLKK